MQRARKEGIAAFRKRNPDLPDEYFYLFSHYRANIGGWITVVPEALLDNLGALDLTVTEAAYAISVTSFQDSPSTLPWTTNAIMAGRMRYDGKNGDRQIRRIKESLRAKSYPGVGKPYLITTPLKNHTGRGSDRAERYDFRGLFEAVALVYKEGKGFARNRKRLHVVEDAEAGLV